MEIEYTLTESDVITLAQYRSQQMPDLRRRIRTRHIALVIGFIIIATGTWIVEANSVLPITFLILAVLSFFLFPAYYNWRLSARITHAYRGEKYQATLRNRALRTTSEGLEDISELGETKVKWDKVSDIVTTPTHTIISIGQFPSIVIPKAQVDAGDYEGFIQVCRNHIEKVDASSSAAGNWA